MASLRNILWPAAADSAPLVGAEELGADQKGGSPGRAAWPAAPCFGGAAGLLFVSAVVATAFCRQVGTVAPEARSSEFLHVGALDEAPVRLLTELRYHEGENAFFDPLAWGPEDVLEAWYEDAGGKERRDVKLRVQQLLRSHEAVYASDRLFAGEETEVIRVEDYAGDFLNAMYKPEDILRAWHGKATQPWTADAGVDVTQAVVDLVRKGMLVNVPDNPIEPQVWYCHNYIAGQGPGFCRGVHHFVEYRMNTGWCGGCHCCKRPVLQRDRPKLVVDYAALKKHYALLHEQVPSDCSVFGGADCVHELSHWAGAGNCAVQAATRGTCREYCSKHGRRCVKAMDNGGGRCHGGGGLGALDDVSCDVELGDQICACSLTEAEELFTCHDYTESLGRFECKGAGVHGDWEYRYKDGCPGDCDCCKRPAKVLLVEVRKRVKNTLVVKVAGAGNRSALHFDTLSNHYLDTASFPPAAIDDACLRVHAPAWQPGQRVPGLGCLAMTGRVKAAVQRAPLSVATLRSAAKGDCSSVGGKACPSDGEGTCAALVRSRGTCKDYCESHGHRLCVNAVDNEEDGQCTRLPDASVLNCQQDLQDQICVCSAEEGSSLKPQELILHARPTGKATLLRFEYRELDGRACHPDSVVKAWCTSTGVDITVRLVRALEKGTAIMPHTSPLCNTAEIQVLCRDQGQSDVHVLHGSQNGFLAGRIWKPDSIVGAFFGSHSAEWRNIGGDGEIVTAKVKTMVQQGELVQAKGRLFGWSRNANLLAHVRRDFDLLSPVKPLAACYQTVFGVPGVTARWAGKRLGQTHYANLHDCSSRCNSLEECRSFVACHEKRECFFQSRVLAADDEPHLVYHGCQSFMEVPCEQGVLAMSGKPVTLKFHEGEKLHTAVISRHNSVAHAHYGGKTVTRKMKSGTYFVVGDHTFGPPLSGHPKVLELAIHERKGWVYWLTSSPRLRWPGDRSAVDYLTVATQLPTGFSAMNGVPGKVARILGSDHEFDGMNTKTRLYLEAVRQIAAHDPHRMVVLLDDDTGYGGCSEKDLLEKYRKTVAASGGAPVVAGGDHHFVPHYPGIAEAWHRDFEARRATVMHAFGLNAMEFRDHLSAAHDDYFSLNSGFLMGPAWAMLEVSECMAKLGWQTSHSYDHGAFHDQTGAQRCMAKYPHLLTQDWAGALMFLTSTVKPGLLEDADGRIYNHWLKSSQCFIHNTFMHNNLDCNSPSSCRLLRDTQRSSHAVPFP